MQSFHSHQKDPSDKSVTNIAETISDKITWNLSGYSGYCYSTFKLAYRWAAMDVDTLNLHIALCCATAEVALCNPPYAPESWLAIRRRVTDEERIWTSPLSRNMRPSVTYFSCESRVFPRGFLMVKFSTYFSRGSSREPIFPSSHSLYSISVGKILDKLAILTDG